jgi:hypothetical protein
VRVRCDAVGPGCGVDVELRGDQRVRVVVVERGPPDGGVEVEGAEAPVRGGLGLLGAGGVGEVVAVGADEGGAGLPGGLEVGGVEAGFAAEGGEAGRGGGGGAPFGDGGFAAGPLGGERDRERGVVKGAFGKADGERAVVAE